MLLANGEQKVIRRLVAASIAITLAVSLFGSTSAQETILFHIGNRRAKLETFGWPRSITTIPGCGYRFCWQSEHPVEVTA